MGDPRVDDAPDGPRRRDAHVGRGVPGSSTKARLQRCSTARPRGSFAPRIARLPPVGVGHDGVLHSWRVELWSTAAGALWWSSPRHLYQRARPAGGASRARRRRADRPSRAERAEILSSRNISSQNKNKTCARSHYFWLISTRAFHPVWICPYKIWLVCPENEISSIRGTDRSKPFNPNPSL